MKVQKLHTDGKWYAGDIEESDLPDGIGGGSTPRNQLLNSNFDIWQRYASNLEISNRSRSANVATITTNLEHGYETGDEVQISNMDSSGYNGEYLTITVTGTNTFTYANAGSNEASTAETGGFVILTSRISMTVSDQECFADRWVALKSTDEMIVYKGDGLKFEHGSSEYSGFVQVIPSRYKQGSTFSIALKAKTNSGSPKMRIALLDWNSDLDQIDFNVVDTWSSDPTLETDWSYAGKSDQVTLTTDYQTISKENISVTGNNIAFAVFTEDVSSGQVIEIKECQLLASANIEDYELPNVEDELNECRKFYRKSYALNEPAQLITEQGLIKYSSSSGISNGNPIGTIMFERMYDVPVVTLYSSIEPPVADKWEVSTGVQVGVTTENEGENSFVLVNDSGFSISTSSVNGHYVAEVDTI
jgi:hypothetical protein